MAAPKKTSPAKKRVTTAKVSASKKLVSKKTVAAKRPARKQSTPRDTSHFEMLATITFTVLAFLFFALIVVKYTWQ